MSTGTTHPREGSADSAGLACSETEARYASLKGRPRSSTSPMDPRRPGRINSMSVSRGFDILMIGHFAKTAAVGGKAESPPGARSLRRAARSAGWGPCRRRDGTASGSFPRLDEFRDEGVEIFASAAGHHGYREHLQLGRHGAADLQAAGVRRGLSDPGHPQRFGQGLSDRAAGCRGGGSRAPQADRGARSRRDGRAGFRAGPRGKRAGVQDSGPTCTRGLRTSPISRWTRPRRSCSPGRPIFCGRRESSPPTARARSSSPSRPV